MADASALGADGGNPMEVQVLSPAPTHEKTAIPEGMACVSGVRSLRCWDVTVACDGF